MIRQFKEFLTKTNAMALAIGVIIGAATGKVVSALVADILMPIISMVMPEGTDWLTATIPLFRGKAIAYGDFLGTVIDFLLISYVVFLIAKALIKEAPAAPTRTCPYCLEACPEAATKCRACASNLAVTSA